MGAPTGVSDVLSCLPVRPFARIRAAHVTSLGGQPAINNFPREAKTANGRTEDGRRRNCNNGSGMAGAGGQKRSPDEAS